MTSVVFPLWRSPMKKLEITSLKKIFGTVTANDCVDFDLEQQEVHCILGENGAGKTTLMNCIYGIYSPDGGEILLDGEPFTVHSVNDSIQQGIGMVHQHFMLVHNMTVLENIMLGLKSTREPFTDKKRVTLELKELMSRFRIKLDLNQEIQSMSVGAQQSVEILKALYRKSTLLILDEPTAVLTPAETGELFDFIRNYIDQGNSVILITHKLEEILDISNRITVMRGGRHIGTYRREEIRDKHELAAKMVGEDIELSLSNESKPPAEKVPVLQVENLVVKDHRGLAAVDNVSLELYRGEILGIAGVSGNGQTELAEALSALRKPFSGKVVVAGEEVRHFTPREMQKRNLRYIPEDRHRYGLVLKFSVKDNMLLSRYYESPYSKKGKLNHLHNKNFAEKKIADYSVLTPGIDTHADNLSGGNQQKLILARELASQPDVLIATQPTRGLDVSATRFVQRAILKQKEQGTAVLYMSTALDEVIDMSDRVAVMYKGKIVGTFDSRTADVKKIGALMAGHKVSEAL
jgi:general nucleoside transport system ATP-binding protein